MPGGDGVDRDVTLLPPANALYSRGSLRAPFGLTTQFAASNFDSAPPTVVFAQSLSFLHNRVTA